MKTMEYTFVKINEGTAREKDVVVEEAYDLNAGLKEYNRYYVVEINGKFVGFPIHTNFECIKAMAGLGDDERVRIYYGNPVTGLCDRDDDCLKHDNGRVDLRWDSIWEGYISQSRENIKLRKRNDRQDIKVGHLILHHYRVPIAMFLSPTKFYKVRPEMIVRIEHSNKQYGGIIWSHPNFNLVEGIL